MRIAASTTRLRTGHDGQLRARICGVNFVNFGLGRTVGLGGTRHPSPSGRTRARAL